MLSRRDHLGNFVKGLEANPKQFPDFGPRLGEISAPNSDRLGTPMTAYVPMDAGLRLLAGMRRSRSCIFTATAATGLSGKMPTFLIAVAHFLART